MKTISLYLIRFYQKFLSPLKGFSCAYRVQTGHESCSAFGHRAINKHGFFRGLYLIRKRLDKCSFVAKQPRSLKFSTQQGFVDCCDLPDCGGCDCDLPSCNTCNVMSFCTDFPSCNCNLGSSGAEREEKRQEEREERREEIKEE